MLVVSRGQDDGETVSKVTTQQSHKGDGFIHSMEGRGDALRGVDFRVLLVILVRLTTRRGTKPS